MQAYERKLGIAKVLDELGEMQNVLEALDADLHAE